MNKNQQIRFRISVLITVVGCIFFISMKNALESHPPLQVGILMALGFGCVFWIITSPKFFHQFVGETSAESLAIIRIIVCSITFFIILLFSDVSQTALLPESMIQPMGVMQFFYVIPGLMELGRNQGFLQILQWVTALILFLGIIGWQTRIAIPLGALCFLFLGGIERQYSYLNHQGIILFDLLIVLSFTPCANALSIDSYRNLSPKESNSDSKEMLSIYGWSRYACWVTVAMAYFIAGMSKIRIGGFFWWEPINLKTKLYQCSLIPCDNISNFDYSLKLIHAPDIMFAIFGIFGFFGELAFVLVLFYHNFRIVFPLLMISMHIGILFLQNILFIDFILLQLIFFDLEKVKIIFPKKLLLFPYIKLPLFKFKLSKINQQTNVKNSRLFYPSMIGMIVIILSISWYYQFKFYPLTPWAVYSNRETSGKITYYKLNANYESGYSGSAHPEKLSTDSLYNAYKTAIKNCFSEEKAQIAICEEFVQVYPELNKHNIDRKNQIRSLKLEQWQWDFKKYPDDKNYGNLIDYRSYNIENNQ